MTIEIHSQGLSLTDQSNTLPSREAQEELLQKFGKSVTDSDEGFLALPQRNDLLLACQNLYTRHRDKKHFVHIGIGGSSLGPQMLLSALNHRHKSPAPSFTFVNNIDPDELHRQLAPLNFRKTLFYIVSKSGRTPETLAGFSIICQKLLQAGVSSCELKDFCITATDPGENPLGKLAEQWELPRLNLPSQVGGRYSVLSQVGLLPALAAGLDVQALLMGAAEMRKQCLAPLKDNPLANMAASLIALARQGFTQTVLMPYSSQLRNLSSWFVQLWAESLGKKHNSAGEIVHTGLTPIPAYGSTDQHGQMQLFMEGPKDKVFILLEVESFAQDFPLDFPSEMLPPKTLGPPEEFRGRQLSELMSAHFYATLKALKRAERPLVHLRIPRLDEESLGALIVFFECMTVMVGISLDINPFDQPGVELGKKYARHWPSRKSTDT